LNEWTINRKHMIDVTLEEIKSWINIQNTITNDFHCAECKELGIKFESKSKHWIEESKIKPSSS